MLNTSPHLERLTLCISVLGLITSAVVHKTEHLVLTWENPDFHLSWGGYELDHLRKPFNFLVSTSVHKALGGLSVGGLSEAPRTELDTERFAITGLPGLNV